MRRPTGRVQVGESKDRREARTKMMQEQLDNVTANDRELKLEMINLTDMSAVRILAKGKTNDVSEAEFVKYFLPMFHAKFNEPLYTREEIDEMKYSTESGLALEVDAYLRLAGGPYNKVNVVNTNGEVLYTIPPMLQMNNVNLRTKNDRPSVSSITQRLSDESRINPKIAAMNFNRDIQKTLIKSDGAAKPLETLLFWNSVFKRYGLKEIPIETPNLDTPTETTEKNEEKLFNDDW